MTAQLSTTTSERYRWFVLDSAHSNLIRAAAYVIVAGLALFARHRERERAREVDGVWWPFWWLTAGFLLALAFGRAGVGSLLSDIGRGRAADSGWFATRRSVQVAAVGAIAALGVLGLGVACGRSAERRRRYLPMGVVVAILASFAAIRLVSLHQVDTLLHRREIALVQVGTMIEYLLLVAAALATAWVPRGIVWDEVAPNPDDAAGQGPAPSTSEP